MSIPILIPLGTGSTHHNDELRLALRSIERNAVDVGDVYLITTSCPEWVDRTKLNVVPIPDIYKDCKDACLFHKVHETLRMHPEIGKFVFMADDNAILKSTVLSEIPNIHNHRPNSVFYCKNPSKWQMRVRRTLEWAKSLGVNLEHNFDAHCPALLDGELIRKRIGSFKYYPDSTNGKTIITAWRVVTDSWRDSQNQLDWKETYEMPCTARDVVFDKPFLGYNDVAFGGIRERLFKEFPEPSRWENT